MCQQAVQCTRNPQEVTVKVESKVLAKKGKLSEQQIVCNFLYLYWEREVGITIRIALNAIAVDSSKSTERIMKHVEQFLTCMHTATNTSAGV